MPQHMYVYIYIYSGTSAIVTVALGTKISGCIIYDRKPAAL